MRRISLIAVLSFIVVILTSNISAEFPQDVKMQPTPYTRGAETFSLPITVPLNHAQWEGQEDTVAGEVIKGGTQPQIVVTVSKKIRKRISRRIEWRNALNMVELPTTNLLDDRNVPNRNLLNSTINLTEDDLEDMVDDDGYVKVIIWIKITNTNPDSDYVWGHINQKPGPKNKYLGFDKNKKPHYIFLWNIYTGIIKRLNVVVPTT